MSSCPAWPATIVLDPGHGGNDGGAVSGNQFVEKRFTLALAQKVADRLAVRHRIELTRTADIEIVSWDRAAVANHLRADLMVSLHAAVPPYCSDRTATVYYHDDARLSFPSDIIIPGMPTDASADRLAWAKLQSRHQHRSQYLATTLKEALSASASFDSVSVYGVPLAPLMGADMPAVLMEVGCAHSNTEPNPQALEKQLNAYAKSIAKAIETALSGLEQ